MPTGDIRLFNDVECRPPQVTPLGKVASMQTDERAGPSGGVEGDLPPRPRFFGRRAWYRRRLAALERQTVLDDLTGLQNQRALWRELTRQTSSCSTASPLAVVMVDFDRFSEVNGRYGRAVGDAVLERGAAVLLAAAGSPDSVFRYGGEEFVLLLAGDAGHAGELAERIRADISRENSHLQAITISCGVAALDSPVEPWVALDRADAALREAKRAGRNRVVLAGETERTTSAYLAEEQEYETARRAALAVAVATLEVRDPYTADHSDDVLTLCESLSRELGFEGAELERLMAGAQLHDVGKVAVPSEILNKAGSLDADEWAVIREHTVIGERILRSVPEMAEVATIVRHSHERWDGDGYPDGLAGEAIPLASRVILCADAFHAIRSDRPYRAGRPAADALHEVRACAGTQFDPAVVDGLVRLSERARSRSGAMALPRNRRLVLLLTALALAGSAIAAMPELRDGVRSVFAAETPKPAAPAPGRDRPHPRAAHDGDRPGIATSALGAGTARGSAATRARRAQRAEARAVRRARMAHERSGSDRTSRTALTRERRPVAETRATPPGATDRGGDPVADNHADGRGTTVSPAEACKGAGKEHVKGRKGTAFSRCVTGVVKRRREARKD
jgi:diguanylate cyclase (GGDEF)-like protein/putative nucleotidyltransferase with HDIG domain